MKVFKNLNDKEKFFRAIWAGLAAILILTVVVLIYVEDTSNKIIILALIGIAYSIDLIVRYRKFKKSSYSH